MSQNFEELVFNIEICFNAEKLIDLGDLLEGKPLLPWIELLALIGIPHGDEHSDDILILYIIEFFYSPLIKTDHRVGSYPPVLGYIHNRHSQKGGIPCSIGSFLIQGGKEGGVTKGEDPLKLLLI